MASKKQLIDEVLASINAKEEQATKKTSDNECRPNFYNAVNKLGIKLKDAPSMKTAKTIEAISDKMRKIAAKAGRIDAADENITAYITLFDIAATARSLSELMETIKSLRAETRIAEQLKVKPDELVAAMKEKEEELETMLKSNCLTQRLSKDIYLQVETAIIADVADSILLKKEGGKLYLSKDPYGLIRDALRGIVKYIKAGKLDASWKAVVETTAAIVSKALDIKLTEEEKSPELK